MNLRRLASMPLPVLLDRGRQEIERRMDCYRISPAAVGSGWSKPGRLSPGRFRTVHGAATATGGRFFPGALEAGNGQPALAESSLDAKRIIDSAASYRSGRFDFLGYANLSFGRPIDWHYDPISGLRSPRRHWSLIDPLDAAVVGDSKVTWELNRHQWLVRLGQAFRLDGDTRNADVFVAAIRDWMRENPPSVGINWASSLEVAIRLMAWCWTLVLFRGAAELTEDLRTEMRAWIGVHAAHVEHYLSHSFSPNTHLTGEALGLYYAGTACPDLVAAGRWRRRGRDILLRELIRQVHEDGVYFEQSTCYQRYTAEIYLHFILLARLNEESLPAFVGERVQGLIDWLVALQHPDGSIPRIGDEDGGWLLPLMPRPPDDCRGVFALAAATFRRADYAWAARGENSEVAWIMGRGGLRVLAALEPRPPRGGVSRHFPRGGYVVMRDSWRRDANQLILDAGPLGCHHSAGHGHADLLSVQCAAFGHPVLVDSGTYCYTPDPVWRNYLRGTFAHNTAIVDGAGQAESLDTFRWRTRPRAHLNAWYTLPDADYADAAHEAFMHLPGAIGHRRRVLFVKPDYWIIVDDFTGGGVHEIRLRYQFAPGTRYRESRGWSQGTVAAGPGLLVRAFAPVTLTSSVYTGSLEPVGGWVSEGYGRLTPAPQLDCRGMGTLPLRLVSLLVPVAGEHIEPPDVTVEFSGDWVCRIRTDGREILVTEETASIEKSRRKLDAAAPTGASRESTPCVP